MADIELRFVDNSSEAIEEMLKKKAIALETIGLVAEGYAKRLCAVDTGRLRNSITHTTSVINPVSPEPPATLADSEVKGTPENDAAYIGTNVEYAPYVELGTVRTPAQPFLRPALADHIQQYKNILEATMKE